MSTPSIPQHNTNGAISADTTEPTPDVSNQDAARNAPESITNTQPADVTLIDQATVRDAPESTTDSQQADSTLINQDDSSTPVDNPFLHIPAPIVTPPIVADISDDTPPFLPIQKVSHLILTHGPSKDELQMAFVGINNSKVLCRQLESLRTRYSFQATMYHCRSYGLFNESSVFPVVPKLVKEDEEYAQIFHELATRVDGTIRGLKRSASFMETSVANDRNHRASEKELMYAERRERESKKVRKDPTSSPVKMSSSSSGSLPIPFVTRPILHSAQAHLTGAAKQTLVDELRES
ncbi:hypothetical protein BGX26_005921, partial [Mortierella sp. AD094]